MHPDPALLCGSSSRLEVLRSYQVLDTPPEPEFDEIVRLGAYVCEAPVALISLVDAARQWFKAEVGLGIAETTLENSICAHALQEPEFLLVHDTLADARFAGFPIVKGPPHVRFYAGAVLRAPEGEPLGTLCVLDFKPRSLGEDQQVALKALARQVMTQLELRRTLFRQGLLLEEQARAAVELTEARLAAEAGSEAKSRFLANLSHELRTPLNPVLMATASLREREDLSPEVLADLEMIRRNVELETRLIDDMLDITRINHGKMELMLETLDLHATLRHAIDISVSEANKKEMELKYELEAREHHVAGDSGRLQQVFWNLIKNAVKFTPASGEITIRSRNDTEGNILVEVIDTGIGLEPAMIDSLFQPFEQGSREITSRFGGLGLGLAISEAIVARHQGRIWAASEGPGRGSTFAVALRCVPAPESVARGKQYQPVKSARALRILLVEDHENTAQILQRLLERDGHKVTHASTRQEAEDRAAEQDFDLLISDLGLPDGTGYALVRALMMRKAMPAIALSGYGMEADLSKSKAAGFLEHLTKPVVWQQLRAAIARVPVPTPATE